MQLPHLQVGDIWTDLTDGLADGCYLVEARQAGNLLLGEVVYNREALDRAELFAPGAFTSVADPLVLRLQHDRAAAQQPPQQTTP